MSNAPKAGTGEQSNNEEDEDPSSENIELDSEGKHPDLNVSKMQFEFGDEIVTIQARALHIAENKVQKTFQKFKSIVSKNNNLNEQQN